MSSFYDDAGTLFQQQTTAEGRVKVMKAVFDRVKGYMEWITKNSLKGDGEKVVMLQQKLDTAFERMNQPHYNGDLMIQELHTWGHAVGTARVRIRNRGNALDSPYWPGHYDVLSKELK